MANLINKPEDISDEKARALFMAFSRAFHGGNIRAAIAEHNQNMLELEEIEKRQNVEQKSANRFEINLRFAKHQ